MAKPEFQFQIYMTDTDGSERKVCIVKAKDRAEAERKGRKTCGKRFSGAVQITG